MENASLDTAIRRAIALGFWKEGIVDVDGIVDEQKNVRYMGTARRQEDGTWTCLANVSGALCIVEVTITIPEAKS